MTIANGSAAGTGTSSTSGASFTLTTTSNAFSAGDFGLLRVVTDNIATTDGATSTHTGISGWTGTATKLGEQTNTVGGAVGDGVTISLWLLEASDTVAIGTVLTISLSDVATDKAAGLHRFTKAAGAGIRVPTGVSIQATTADATNNPGSLAFSGLPTGAYLFVRAIGIEANPGLAGLTVTSGFASLNFVRSRNNAAAVATTGEYQGATSASGSASAPTLPVTCDNASLFIVLEEYTASQQGDATGAFGGSTTVTAQAAAASGGAEASGPLGSVIALAGLGGAVVGDAGASGGLGAAVATTALGGAAAGSAGASGGLGAAVATTALGGAAAGSAGASGALAGVSLSTLAAASAGSGNAAGFLGATIAVAASGGGAEGGASASGALGGTAMLSALGGAAESITMANGLLVSVVITPMAGMARVLAPPSPGRSSNDNRDPRLAGGVLLDRYAQTAAAARERLTAVSARIAASIRYRR